MEASDRIKAPAKGTFTLTRSPTKPFTFTEIEFDDTQANVWFSGTNVVAKGHVESLNIILPEKEGAHSGIFGAHPNAAGYFNLNNGKVKNLWSSHSGTYQCVYNTKSKKLTGTYTFTARCLQTKAWFEFAGNFDIQVVRS